MTLKDELTPGGICPALPGQQSYLLHLNPRGTEWEALGEQQGPKTF